MESIRGVLATILMPFVILLSSLWEILRLTSIHFFKAVGNIVLEYHSFIENETYTFLSLYLASPISRGLWLAPIMICSTAPPAFLCWLSLWYLPPPNIIGLLFGLYFGCIAITIPGLIAETAKKYNCWMWKDSTNATYPSTE